MKLVDQYRPRQWSEIIGQAKVLAKIDALRPRGLSGRAYWLSGQSGTGKTSIALLLAGEVASDFATITVDSTTLTAGDVADLRRMGDGRALDGRGWAFIVNEAHGLRKTAIRPLLDVLDPVSVHATWIFTTTVEGQQQILEDMDDSHPLLSRCTMLPLARRDLAKPFAARAREIAQAEGLDGQPIERYVRLAQDCGNNMREILQRIESGEMVS